MDVLPLVFQITFAKVTPPVIYMPEILRQTPHARLLLDLLRRSGMPLFVQDIRQRFVTVQVRSATDRYPPRQANQQYVLYRQADLALDPFPLRRTSRR